VILFSVAAFLAVLALLAGQLRSGAAPAAPRPVILIRRIYETRVVETVPGRGSGTSVSQSVLSTGSTIPAAPAPTTRSSHL
jgi:hypothetical protein